jgi:hypothetical protein
MRRVPVLSCERASPPERFDGALNQPCRSSRPSELSTCSSARSVNLLPPSTEELSRMQTLWRMLRAANARSISKTVRAWLVLEPLGQVVGLFEFLRAAP